MIEHEIEYENEIYSKTIDLLTEIKLTLGPTGLAGTLRKHPNLKEFVVKKQKERLEILDQKIPNRQMDFLNAIDNA